MIKTLYTIGYEGVTAEALVRTLVEAKIEVLLDVRAVPLSRKPGLSKNKLAARLQENGIRYLGLKNLGTPAEGRHAARKGKISEMHAIFEKQLETDKARAELEDAKKIAQSQRSCLLCFENDAEVCHRKIVAQHIQSATHQKIENLNPIHYL